MNLMRSTSPKQTTPAPPIPYLEVRAALGRKSGIERMVAVAPNILMIGLILAVAIAGLGTPGTTLIAIALLGLIFMGVFGAGQAVLTAIDSGSDQVPACLDFLRGQPYDQAVLKRIARQARDHREGAPTNLAFIGLAIPLVLGFLGTQQRWPSYVILGAAFCVIALLGGI